MMRKLKLLLLAGLLALLYRKYQEADADFEQRPLKGDKAWKIVKIAVFLLAIGIIIYHVIFKFNL
jgi:hypothetical protein